MIKIQRDLEWFSETRYFKKKNEMAISTQNREFLRTEHELPILYKQKGADKFFGGIMRNYSVAGICFETGQALKPGSEIIINHKK